MIRRFLLVAIVASGAAIGLAGPASAVTDVLSPTAIAFYQLESDPNSATTTPKSTGPLTTASYESAHGYLAAWRAVYPLPKAAVCKVTGATFSTYVRSFDPEPPPYPDATSTPFALLASHSATGEAAGTVQFAPEVGERQTNDVTTSVARLVAKRSKSISITVSAGFGSMQWDGPGNPEPPALEITCGTGDKDRDGVPNTRDVCAGTPGRDGILHLKPNNYANRNRHFVSGAGVDSGLTLDDTVGCSAIQIGRSLGASRALSILSSGIPLPTLQAWVATHRPN